MRSRRLGGQGRGGGLARLHPDGCLRRQRAPGRRAGRGSRVDRRRGPALPGRHLLPLGEHPRPPSARTRRGPRRPSGEGRPLHHARQHQRGGHRAGRGPGRRGAGGRPPFPLRRRRRGGRRAGPQDRLPVLGQPAARSGRTRFLALGDAYHGDTVGSLSLGDGGVFSAVFDPLCFQVLRTPGYADPGLGRRRPARPWRPTPGSWPPW